LLGKPRSLHRQMWNASRVPIVELVDEAPVAPLPVKVCQDTL